MSRKSLVLIAVSLFALALYTAGLRMASMATFALAIMVELWFWIKATRHAQKNKPSDKE